MSDSSKAGRPRGPDSIRLGLFLPVSLHDELKQIAEIDSTSVSEVVRFAITQYINRRTKDEQHLEEVAEPPMMEDLILQRLDKFVAEYRIMKERLDLIRAVTEEQAKSVQEFIKNNPELLKMSEPQIEAFTNFAKVFLEQTQDSIKKRIENNADR
jgi:metal-responsive CopG/Arc/MetJ family transcriptional regulator